jgi:CheY-like chemotaxis protein
VELEVEQTQQTDPISTNGTTGNGSDGRKTRILIVDDHADTSTVMKMLLERRGYEVMTADSVGNALDVASRNPFDLLISDIGLPDGSGLELIGRLNLSIGTPAIALSGFGMEEDVRKSMEAGFREHLVKPVSFQQLYEVIQRLIPA